MAAAAVAAALLAHGAAFAAAQGNPACWQGGFDYKHCCEGRGPEGNGDCWDTVFTYSHCCLNDGGSEDANDFEGLIARGKTGDASVLPRIMQFLSAGGELGCADSAEDPPDMRCLGTPRGPSKTQWRTFFEAQSLSKFLRLQPFPPDGDPQKLYDRCCSGDDANEVLKAMFADCASGTAALVLNQLSGIEKRFGLVVARRRYVEVQNVVSGRTADDCRWKQQVNHAAFPHVSWFLSSQGEISLPCAAGSPRVFVDERPEWSALHAHSLTCASRGLCFTEVWVHQFLRRATCRAETLEEADFVYVPVYASCYGLDTSRDRRHIGPLGAIYNAFGARADDGKQPPLLVLMTCEKWKLRGWRKRLGRSPFLIAAVEARTLLVEGEEDLEDGAATAAADAPSWEAAEDGVWRSGARPGATVSHCEDCFEPQRDLVIPSAVLPNDAARLKSFSREPRDRQLLATWHGEHANSKSRDDVAQGYREVNETVRLDLLKNFQNKVNVSVGGPSMRYAFLMGASHFCLVPRGRGWWTVRLFEAFYAGCVPVILSDDVELPFEDFLDWPRFSLKWPMRRIHEGLYEYLTDLVANQSDRLDALHRGVREVRCWFDYHEAGNDKCSPYLGLLRQLKRKQETRREGREVAGLWRPSRRFWF